MKISYKCFLTEINSVLSMEVYYHIRKNITTAIRNFYF